MPASPSSQEGKGNKGSVWEFCQHLDTIYGSQQLSNIKA